MTPTSASADDAPRRGPTPRSIAWVDGRVVPARDATVPLTDDGFLRGDAVFDAALVRRGRTHAIDAHLARLRASAKAMGIRVPAIRQVITDLLLAWGEHDGSIKIVVTRNGTVRGLLTTPTWPETISLEVIEMPWRTVLSGVKTVSYAANQWAQRQALAAHADDALITQDAIAMELPTGAICWISDGVVHTPDPASLPILDSVTVRELAAITEVAFGVHPIADVLAADEVFVVSATRPILAVHAIGDSEFPAPGPVTTGLRTAFNAHIDATLDALT